MMEHDSSYKVNEIALHKFRVNGDIKNESF